MGASAAPDRDPPDIARVTAQGSTLDAGGPTTLWTCGGLCYRETSSPPETARSALNFHRSAFRTYCPLQGSPLRSLLLRFKRLYEAVCLVVLERPIVLLLIVLQRELLKPLSAIGPHSRCGKMVEAWP